MTERREPVSATSHEERELKFGRVELAHLRDRLLELQAERVAPPAFEDNWIFDRGKGELHKEGAVLRLRVDGHGAQLTFKGPPKWEESTKVRSELETRLDDAEVMQEILRRLGYKVHRRYQKMREEWRLGAVLICARPHADRRLRRVRGAGRRQARQALRLRPRGGRAAQLPRALRGPPQGQPGRAARHGLQVATGWSSNSYAVARVRALVLAAGYGTRLRPLTDELPKPLLPVLGRPLLLRTLDALVDAGCEAAAINLHHLAEAIPAAVGDEHRGMRLVYSREEPILGTGGAFVPLRDFFAGSDTALLVNGDSLCDGRSSSCWRGTGGAARRRRCCSPAGPIRGGSAAASASTAMVACAPSAASRPSGRWRGGSSTPAPTRSTRRCSRGCRKDSPIRCATSSSRCSPRAARIDSLVTWKPWHDLGTPARYLEAMLDLSARADAGWRSGEASVAAGADLRRAVVESGCPRRSRRHGRGFAAAPGRCRARPLPAAARRHGAGGRAPRGQRVVRGAADALAAGRDAAGGKSP